MVLVSRGGLSLFAYIFCLFLRFRLLCTCPCVFPYKIRLSSGITHQRKSIAKILRDSNGLYHYHCCQKSTCSLLPQQTILKVPDDSRACERTFTESTVRYLACVTFLCKTSSSQPEFTMPDFTITNKHLLTLADCWWLLNPCAFGNETKNCGLEHYWKVSGAYCSIGPISPAPRSGSQTIVMIRQFLVSCCQMTSRYCIQNCCCPYTIQQADPKLSLIDSDSCPSILRQCAIL